jgi:hypothetical protein
LWFRLFFPAGKHNRRNHDTPAHRPRNYTLYGESILPLYFPINILNILLKSVPPHLLVYVHKHTHFGFYLHVYSATVLPYAIAFFILLFYRLGHILYSIHFYHVLTHCTFRCYYVIQSVLLYTRCFTH